jgi:phospholipid-binding lipoprotein MlaA
MPDHVLVLQPDVKREFSLVFSSSLLAIAIAPGLVLENPPVHQSAASAAPVLLAAEQAALRAHPDPWLSPDSSVDEAAPALTYDLNEDAGEFAQDEASKLPADPLNRGQAGEETIIVTGKTEMDPIESLSLDTFDVAQDIDRALVGPAAMAYGETVPRPVRSGLRNFFRNLSEPIVMLNYLLQLKPGKAAETAGRFVINTGLGFGGLVDMAKKPGVNLPYRHNGFANTLGFYGVKPGQYMFLPLIGSTTIRDLLGNSVDMVLMPAAYGSPVNKPLFGLSAGVVDTLEGRIEIDQRLRQMRATSADPYGSQKDYYLSFRQAEIDALKGGKADIEEKQDTEETEETGKSAE